jgi:hypothetical protein
MNKNGHEAKQDMEVPPEFVANGFSRQLPGLLALSLRL